MVEVVLARAATALPGPGWAYEPKWDGWRGVLSRDGLVARQGKDLSRHFPELLHLLPDGTTVDGEVVCWRDGRLDFGGLHQRARRSEAAVGLVALDVLEHQGAEERAEPYRQRRALLESLALSPPLYLVENTTGRETALR